MEGSGKVPTIELKGVDKSFGSVQALSGVDLEAHAGEVVGLVGDNGAGKSTLVGVISGRHAQDSGEIIFEGEKVHITDPKDAGRLGIETVYQDLALCDNLDIVANLFLGRESGSSVRIGEIGMERQAIDTLKTLQVELPSVRTPVAGLSGGQRQSVAVSRAVMWNSKLVLLDEPTAALGVAQTKQVLELIKRLREQGLAVVVISHNLRDVFEVVDRVIVLRLGQRVATFDVKTTSAEQVVAAITGAEFGGESETGPVAANQEES